MRGSYNLGLLSVRLSPSERKQLLEGKSLEGMLRGYVNTQPFSDDLLVFQGESVTFNNHGRPVLEIPTSLLSASLRRPFLESDLIFRYSSGKYEEEYVPPLPKGESPGPFLVG